MTWDDIVDLLTLITAYDQRTVGEEDVRAWLLVAQLEGWTPRAAQRAVVEHYARGADRPRITPAAVTDRIRDLRRRAAATFEPPAIPDELPDADYPAWLRAQRDRHIDALIEWWAETGEEPQPALTSAPERIRTLPELIAAAPRHVRHELVSAAARIQARRVDLDGEGR